MLLLRRSLALGGSSSRARNAAYAFGLTRNTVRSSSVSSAARRAASRTNSARVLRVTEAARSIKSRSCGLILRCSVSWRDAGDGFGMSAIHSELSLKEPPQKPRRFFCDADDLVRRLPVEFEIELGLGAVVAPIPEELELASSERPLRRRDAADGDADARRLPGDAGLPGDRFGRCDNAEGDEALPTFILAREQEDCVAC